MGAFFLLLPFVTKLPKSRFPSTYCRYKNQRKMHWNTFQPGNPKLQIPAGEGRSLRDTKDAELHHHPQSPKTANHRHMLSIRNHPHVGPKRLPPSHNLGPWGSKSDSRRTGHQRYKLHGFEVCAVGSWDKHTALLRSRSETPQGLFCARMSPIHKVPYGPNVM